jgi:uncharacterized membrane protein YqjE
MLNLAEIRPAIGALLTHGALLAKLAQVEWTTEKLRLARLFALSLFAVVMSVVLLLTISSLVMVAVWDTPYRWAVALALVVIYATGLMLSLRRLRQLVSIEESAFAGTREELAAGFALLKQRLLP